MSADRCGECGSNERGMRLFVKGPLWYSDKMLTACNGSWHDAARTVESAGGSECHVPPLRADGKTERGSVSQDTRYPAISTGMRGTARQPIEPSGADEGRKAMISNEEIQEITGFGESVSGRTRIRRLLALQRQRIAERLRAVSEDYELHDADGRCWSEAARIVEEADGD